MARRSQHSFIKRQKEIRRQQKAQDKLARRQGKGKQESDSELVDSAEHPEDQEGAGPCSTPLGGPPDTK